MRKRWKLALAAGTLALGWTTWEASRLRRFRVEGVALVARAARFPRTYTAGRGAPRILVALGDSTAAGVGCARLEETLPFLVAEGLGAHCQVANLAVSGATLHDVVREQLPRLPNRPTDLALVSVSANDATRGTDPEAFARNLDTLLSTLEAKRVRMVVLTTTPNFRTTPALPWIANLVFVRRARELTDVIERTAARHPFVRLADLNRLGTLTPDEYAADGFHPAPEGYRRWAEIMVKAGR